MFIEYVKNDSFFDPLRGRPEDKEAIVKAFKDKYGIDLKKIGALDEAHLLQEKTQHPQRASPPY